MKKRRLGNTGLQVSKLCFGSLTMGPLQANLTPDEGGKLLRHSFEKGINFIDTAELYETYPHILKALNGYKRDEIIIASKSYAYSKATAEASLKKALKEMKIDYIDIFLLHEQENENTIRGHNEALEYFVKMKEKGYIRAFGISTHHIAAVKASGSINEIEVIHPIVNMSGLGIQDGNIEDMLLAIDKAHKAGKGIYGMKPLGGGNLLRSFKECFDFVLNISSLDSIAIGMQTIEEININISIANDGTCSEALKNVKLDNKKLSISEWCEKCGKCVHACSHNALKIKHDKLLIDHDKCVLCGYCSKYCPQFCIKVV
ncbi:aldo/keto reductase [Alkaliphilus peptidifermentans]|uniref:4Fe-4S binding domain-containing protein n=1 Tax=Alkaliphilus peptidifermentans DSM 18978 TaxID=1120976 RepID=A0A1G5KCI7_9FIRM|nr:aldo/keto reductase [Alkaliphilus peptidifermentans]SCY98144.1 4Fe-4S binding domain-containing protein [Alkaliphilus peptidifermentans DSM 18978]